MPDEQSFSADRRRDRYRRRVVLLTRWRRRCWRAAGNHIHDTGLAPAARRTDRREWRRGKQVADVCAGYVAGRNRPPESAVKLERRNLTAIHCRLPCSAVVYARLYLYRGPGGQVAIP